jgi:hypothetical protein
MNTAVHHIDVYAPAAAVRPRIIEAIEQLIDIGSDALRAHHARAAAKRERQQFARDVLAARREAYAWMREDPRMGADLLAAIDRQEAMFLPAGSIAR